MSKLTQGIMPPSCVVDEAQRLVREFELDTSALRKVTAHFSRQMRIGLQTQQNWQLPSYVTKIPQGSETGRFLAVDLGGTNCRVSMVELHGSSKYSVEQRKHAVPREIRINPSYKPLFGFIAARIAEFLDTLDGGNKSFAKIRQDCLHDSGIEYKLGFTFSFTYQQKSIMQGCLVQWDKEWDIPSALGRCPCEMLQESINEINLPIQVCVLTNDSVGALLTHSYTLSRPGSALAAVILGTGTNAAYFEKVENIERLAPDALLNASHSGAAMAINTEWGSFDDELKVLPCTEFDIAVDAASTNPGSQMLEKRVSGLYLGEILRLALIRLIEARASSMDVNMESSLYQFGSINTSFMSMLAEMRDDDDTNILNLITDTLDVRAVSKDDCRAIRLVSNAVAQRAARLTAASLAAILIQSGRLSCTCPVPTASSGFIKSNHSKSTFYRLSHRISALTESTICAFRKLFCCLDLAKSQHGLDSCKSVPHCADHSSAEGIEDQISIGTDGSVINLYPGFISTILSSLLEIPEVGADGARRVKISSTGDGSLVGAALMAQSTVH